MASPPTKRPRLKRDVERAISRRDVESARVNIERWDEPPADAARRGELVEDIRAQLRMLHRPADADQVRGHLERCDKVDFGLMLGGSASAIRKAARALDAALFPGTLLLVSEVFARELERLENIVGPDIRSNVMMGRAAECAHTLIGPSAKLDTMRIVTSLVYAYLTGVPGCDPERACRAVLKRGKIERPKARRKP
jgi:hypothetical protein